MKITDPAFVRCAMEAIEEGIRAKSVIEECTCRLSLQDDKNALSSTAHESNDNNPQTKE